MIKYSGKEKEIFMRFTETIKADFHDTDVNRIVRPAALVRYFQSACDHQMTKDRPSSDELLSIGRAFFLSRISLKFSGEVYKNEVLNVSTWAVESKGYSFMRCGLIEKDGAKVMSTVSAWALVDTESRKPTRVSDAKVGYGKDEMIDIGVPLRFSSPKLEDMEKRGSKTVLYSDADFNGHMNNTHYPDILCDFCPGHDGRVREMTIAYNSEAPLGCTFDIYGLRNGEEEYIKTIKSDGSVGIDAKIKFGD